MEFGLGLMTPQTDSPKKSVLPQNLKHRVYCLPPAAPPTPVPFPSCIVTVPEITGCLSMKLSIGWSPQCSNVSRYKTSWQPAMQSTTKEILMSSHYQVWQ